jgi:tetratricopeptide (TPR) repeat protein
MTCILRELVHDLIDSMKFDNWNVTRSADGHMHCDAIEHLVLHLAGPLRLCGADGRDMTPRSQKAQAILALLATTPGLSRPRSWIQDKLWSDSPPERGASNLRQCVHRLRRDVPIKGEWLLSDSQRLALHPDFVSVNIGPAPGDLRLSSEPPEFCEGLDVADAEFEDWIRDRRLDFEDRWAEMDAVRVEPIRLEPIRLEPVRLEPFRVEPVHPPQVITLRPSESRERTVLLIAPSASSDDSLRSLEAILCTDIAANVAHIGGVEIRFQTGEKVAIGQEDAVRLEVRTFRFGENISLQAVLSDPTNGAVFWSDVRHLSSLGSHSFPSDYADAVAHVTSATAVQFAEGPTTGSATRQAYRAICDLLTFDPAKFKGCEQALAGLEGSPKSAALDSWRAYLRVTEILERTSTDPKAAAEEAIALSRRALERDGRNPVVMSHSSHVALHVEKSSQKAWALAKTALEYGAASPLTHAFWSFASTAQGDFKTSLEASRRAMALSNGQPNRSFWFINQCFAKLGLHLYREALEDAVLAHQFSPNFRPSLRYIIALNVHLGNEAGAAEALEKLRVLEPEFTMNQFDNIDYPVETLRRTGLIYRK